MEFAKASSFIFLDSLHDIEIWSYSSKTMLHTTSASSVHSEIWGSRHIEILKQSETCDSGNGEMIALQSLRQYSTLFTNQDSRTRILMTTPKEYCQVV